MRNLYFILEYDAKVDDTKVGIYLLNYKRLKIPRILDVASVRISVSVTSPSHKSSRLASSNASSNFYHLYNITRDK